jgi:hypothetical protein
MLGSELIDSARLAFMDGMVGTAMVSAVVAFITAILVKLYMPGKTK